MLGAGAIFAIRAFTLRNAALSFAPPGRTDSSAVAEAVDRYASFSGQDLELAWQ